MSANHDNIDKFKIVSGIVIQSLMEKFPQQEFVEYEDICGVYCEKFYPEAVKNNTTEFVIDEEFVESTIEWLVKEGYLRREAGMFTLTEKTLAALNVIPLGKNETIGATLSGAAKKAAGETARSAISSVVGELIGAAAKGFIGA
ncbi:hypothetical protein ABLE93_14930 [Xanthobacter sp. KR7-65]|uniref:hypothetical protein n=1 Tax=Xanthobacter sp. KR7-65 TaxID=3156612 RepID=UPI0032B49528